MSADYDPLDDLDTLADTPSSSAPSNSGDPQRRVYALPAEMVDRIVEFQREKGLPSEVEAVRRLLDEALKSRDDVNKVVIRFLARLKVARIASEVAKDVLVGHPLISSIGFDGDRVAFNMRDGWMVSVTDSASVHVSIGNGKTAYVWSAKTPDKYGPGQIVRDPNDITF